MSGKQWVAVFVLTAAAIGWATGGQAQRVHLLVAGDTLDRNVGKAIDRDLGNIVITFFILLREGQLDHARLSGGDVTAENILNAVERFRVQPDDAVVFYWGGHGAFDSDGQYLQMPKGGNLYRSTLLGAMKKKQARLIVLLTDCCNEYSDQGTGKPPISPSSPDPRRGTSPLFDELFFKARGVVDVNAAAQGEVALGTKEGGLFTLSLAYMMPGRRSADDDGSGEPFGVFWHHAQQRTPWQTVIQESRRQVQELFEQVSPDGLAGRDGKVYHRQTVVAWSLPEQAKPQPQPDRGSRFGVEALDNKGEGVRIIRVWAGYPGTRVSDAGSGESLQLQRGDVILSINGRQLHNSQDYWDAVKSSPQTMEFTVRDVRDGQKRNLRAKLRY